MMVNLREDRIKLLMEVYCLFSLIQSISIANTQTWLIHIRI
jgi:hypothetical protein